MRGLLKIAIGAEDEIRTRDFLLGKEGREQIESFIHYRKTARGLTERGEANLRYLLRRYLTELSRPAHSVTVGNVLTFLSVYNDRPHQKDSFYRTLKSFYKWSVKFGLMEDNPMLLIEAPKLPETVLRTITPEQVHILIETAESSRDKAIVALLADSGARRSEFTSIRVNDLDLLHNRILVTGKGQKEGFLVFGERTKEFLLRYINEFHPVGSLFGLKPSGLSMVLRRIGDKAGIPVNPHAFRRGFATTLRKMGVGELDIQQLGRWESLEMVRRYTKAFTFDDAAERYKPIVE